MKQESAPCFFRGLSMLELMIVLAISAVLLSVAVPAYRDHAQRAHRAGAIRILLEISACQERTRSTGGRYDTTLCLPDKDLDAYRFELLPEGETAALEYAAQAVPKNDGDACGTLRLDHRGTRSVGAGAGRGSDCWGGR